MFSDKMENWKSKTLLSQIKHFSVYLFRCSVKFKRDGESELIKSEGNRSFSMMANTFFFLIFVHKHNRIFFQLITHHSNTTTYFVSSSPSVVLVWPLGEFSLLFLVPRDSDGSSPPQRQQTCLTQKIQLTE